MSENIKTISENDKPKRPLTDPYPPIEKMTAIELEFAFACGCDTRFAIELASRFAQTRMRLSEADIGWENDKGDRDQAVRYQATIDMALRIMNGESL